MIASIAGAMESIVCSGWIGTDGVTFYIDWKRADGSPGQRFAHFNHRSPTVDGEIWSEIFTAIAFNPDITAESVIPILCEVSFRKNHDTISAYLDIKGVGVFSLPYTTYNLI